MEIPRPTFKYDLNWISHPAPGFRDALGDRGYGRLWYVGANGYSWSSSVAGANAHYLELYSARIIPQSLNYRAYGFPLRCLREREEDENRRV